MAKGKHSSGMGKYGWTFVSVITITVIASALFFIIKLDLNPLAAFSDSPSTEASDTSADQQTKDKVKEVQETVGKEHVELGKFIAQTHDFYNETTGYGGIASLDWDQQREQAAKIMDVLQEKVPEVKREAFKDDLQRIQNLAKTVQNKEETDAVRSLHRMFHDLDIALNDYNGYDKIWNVTETLKTVS